MREHLQLFMNKYGNSDLCLKSFFLSLQILLALFVCFILVACLLFILHMSFNTFSSMRTLFLKEFIYFGSGSLLHLWVFL